MSGYNFHAFEMCWHTYIIDNGGTECWDLCTIECGLVFVENQKIACDFSSSIVGEEISDVSTGQFAAINFHIRCRTQLAKSGETEV